MSKKEVKDLRPLHWDLSVRVERPHQLDKMVAWLAEYGYDFELANPLGERTEEALLVVHGVWAESLVFLAKRLRRYDMEF